MIEISISTVPYIPVIDIKKNKAFLYIIIVNYGKSKWFLLLKKMYKTIC